MPTHITHIEDDRHDTAVLRVEGSMQLEDAMFLEKIALEIQSQTNKKITLDLSNLNFLDSESAPILKRLEQTHHFKIEGLMIFLQKIVNETERK